jgi:predicted TIM-barrel fold metal-dependent hydrolase
VIVDCHAHVFEPWTTACGHPSQEVHLSYIQQILARTSARVVGGKGTSAPLTSGMGAAWSEHRDVDLRVGRFGRIAFTADGDEHVVQYFPVGMQEIAAPPELMLAQLDYVGVDHCILQAGGAYGAMNDVNAAAQSAYPDRFTGLLNVDEGRAAEPDGLAELERAATTLGLRGVYFSLHGLARYGPMASFADPSGDAFWERVAELGLPVFLELTGHPTYDEPGYRANVQRLAALMSRVPSLRWVLVMGLPVDHYARDGVWSLPPEVETVVRRDEVLVELMFPITWGGVWDYPYVEAQPLVKDLRDRCGAESLIWGSDAPNVERYCTYRQSLDYLRRYCTFLEDRELELILGGNVAALFGGFP